ncbi:RHS repeat domain-containing protein [Lysinibacillus sphaericus]|uniref:RHS repeat domain-containing protein n=1 Tax=Lysinibacillus sphaericus TaxID=1421 RepID=UPI003D0676AD
MKQSIPKKNELETVVDPKQQQTSYEYDGNGNLKKITNARGFVTDFKYNGKNQITEEKITPYL